MRPRPGFVCGGKRPAFFQVINEQVISDMAVGARLVQSLWIGRGACIQGRRQRRQGGTQPDGSEKTVKAEGHGRGILHTSMGAGPWSATYIQG